MSEDTLLTAMLAYRVMDRTDYIGESMTMPAEQMNRTLNHYKDIQSLFVPAPYTVQSPEKNDVRYFVISDTHKGHSSPNFLSHTRRPKNVDDMVEKNWRRLVRRQDIVLHLGDLAFGFVDVKGYLDSLPGIKVLIRGNHDPHTISWYCRNGFAYACDGLVLGGVYYSHRPSKHLPDGARVNVHGHLHNRHPRGFRRYRHCRLFALEYESWSPRIVSKFLTSIERERPVRYGVVDYVRDGVVKLKEWRREWLRNSKGCK